MSVFTVIDLQYLNSKIPNNSLNFSKILWITEGLDNTVYKLISKDENIYVLKIYEWKSVNFMKNLLWIHKLIENNSLNRIVLLLPKLVDQRDWIIFEYIDTNGVYDIIKIINKIGAFHCTLNCLDFTANPTDFLDKLQIETNFFYKNINPNGYIKKYQNSINIQNLFSVFQLHLGKFLEKQKYLNIGYIHNDLCKGNIIPNDINWIEFIDMDWVNFNILIKDYIIFIIRFNLYHKFDNYFHKIENNYQIWKDLVSKEEVKDLYIIFAINLIFNMIYYVWYDEKNVWEENFIDTENQSWQEIYENLKLIL